jgi:hypothetical protein
MQHNLFSYNDLLHMLYRFLRFYNPNIVHSKLAGVNLPHIYRVNNAILGNVRDVVIRRFPLWLRRDD